MDVAPLTVVPTGAEAEMICAVLRTAGIEAFTRQTNTGAGAMQGMPGGGACEVLVAADELEQARAVLDAQPESS